MTPTIHKIGIIMNGVTGRMGTNQHLLRSIVEIIKQGGVKINASEFIMPSVVLVGRDSIKLQKLSQLSGIARYTTDLDSVLNDSNYQLYFDAQTTGRRADDVRKAIKAGKHIYCEKPVAVSTATALELYQLCRQAGLKNGVVQDKLWLPGLLKIKRLIQKAHNAIAENDQRKWNTRDGYRGDYNKQIALYQQTLNELPQEV